MANLYAALSDLPEQYRDNPDAPDLLAAASGIVTRLIRNARFRTVDGMPLDADLEACREAVVRQVRAWLSAGVTPLTGPTSKPRVVASKSLNGASTSYQADGAADAYLNALAAGQDLTPYALAPLEEQGLLSVAILPEGPVTFSALGRLAHLER